MCASGCVSVSGACDHASPYLIVFLGKKVQFDLVKTTTMTFALSGQ